MNYYFELPILTFLHQNKFAMNNDETCIIASVEQLVIYVIFNHKGKLCRNQTHKQNGCNAPQHRKCSEGF